MKSKLRVLIPALMTVPLFAEDPAPSTATQLGNEDLKVAEKIEVIKAADPAKDVQAALDRKDRRFLDLTGYDAVPGVENWTDRLKKTYSTRVIGSSFGMLVDDLDESYFKLREEYAAKYNRLLFEKLGEKAEPAPDLAALPVDKRIDALIERLAISNEPAAEEPVYTPSRDTPKSDRRMVAYGAAEELRKLGYAAFPQLIAKLDDRRQSGAFGRWRRHDVGMACYSILMWQVYSLPDDASASFYRTGADGKPHSRPVHLDQIWEKEGLGPWLEARKKQPLIEIQLEALSWVLDREREIGAQDEEAKKEHIAPLERGLEKLKKEAEAAGQKVSK